MLAPLEQEFPFLFFFLFSSASNAAFFFFLRERYQFVTKEHLREEPILFCSRTKKLALEHHYNSHGL
ncbi:unnamed protein product [Ixodes pacificus]